MRHFKYFPIAKKWIVPFFLFFPLFQYVSYCQTDLGFEQLKNKDFQSALTSFTKDLSHKERKAAAEYGLAKIYLDTSFTNFNPTTLLFSVGNSSDLE